jgi:hypothetical protein
LRGGVLWKILLIRPRENIAEGAGSNTQIPYLTLPWDSRGREVREIVVRASEDILVNVVGANRGTNRFFVEMSTPVSVT